jgi:hypothetical protein
MTAMLLIVEQGLEWDPRHSEQLTSWYVYHYVLSSNHIMQGLQHLFSR